MFKKLTLIGIALMGWFAFTLCSDDNPMVSGNQNPVIQEIITSPENVGPGQTATIMVIAFDPDGDPIVIKYNSTSGTIKTKTANGDTATFTAGSDLGRALVDILVCDDRGGETEAQVSLEIVLQAPCISVSRIEVLTDNRVKFFYTPGEDLLVSRVRIVDPNSTELGEFVPADLGTLKPAGDEFSLQLGDNSYPLRLGGWAFTFFGFRPDGSEYTFVAVAELVRRDDGTIALIRHDCSTAPPRPAPDIAVDPSTHNYGDVTIGESFTQVFVVTNGGNADLEVSATDLRGRDAGAFAIVRGDGPFLLAPGTTHEVEVSFNPTSTDTNNATLRLHSNDADEPLLSVALSGEGVSAPGAKMHVDKDTLKYGDVQVNTNQSLTVVIRNSGAGVLAVTHTNMIGQNPNQFALVRGDAPFTLESGDQKDITVGFNPTTIGEKKATLSIHSNAGDAKVELTGDGINPEINVDTELPFGKLQINEDSTKTLQITNSGTTPLHVTVSIHDGDDFSLATTNIIDVEPNSTEGVMVTFRPSETGERTATLRIESNDFDEPSLPVGLKGNGINPEINVDTELPFGKLQINEDSTKTLQITNSGTTPLHVTVSIHDGDDFSLATTNIIDVEPNSTEGVMVTFRPSETGERTATLRIESNDFDEPSLEVDLRGDGIDPEIDVDTDSVSFDTTKVGDTSSVERLEINNNGLTELVGEVVLAGDDPGEFEITTSNSFRVSAKGPPHLLEFVFNPTSAGEKNAILRIASNDHEKPSLEINLSGTGK